MGEARPSVEWQSVQAEITACEQTWLGQENLSSEGYTPARYRVRFSYVVNGRTYSGSYGAASPQQCGQLLEILYDPANPSSNTGYDVLNKAWVRWVATAFGIGLALLAIWLWGSQDWFH